MLAPDIPVVGYEFVRFQQVYLQNLTFLVFFYISAAAAGAAAIYILYRYYAYEIMPITTIACSDTSSSY